MLQFLLLIDCRCRSPTSADCDHHLVWAKIQRHACSKKRPDHPKLKLDFLKTTERARKYETNIQTEMLEKRQTWPVLAETLKTTANQQGPEIRQPEKQWIDAECLELIEKHCQGPEYRLLCAKIKKACRQAKRNQLKENAMQAEKAFKIGNTRNVYQLGRTISCS